MRREAARDAGLDLTNKTTAKFMQHYEGDFTPDAMKAAAVEWGIMPDVEQAAQESVQGQTQMASAYSGGETQPLGTTTIGDRHHRVEVPAAEAEKWQAFEVRSQERRHAGRGRSSRTVRAFAGRHRRRRIRTRRRCPPHHTHFWPPTVTARP